jgi:hypothetical protein
MRVEVSRLFRFWVKEYKKNKLYKNAKTVQLAHSVVRKILGDI